jgi:hypothetical protein
MVMEKINNASEKKKATKISVQKKIQLLADEINKNISKKWLKTFVVK